MKVTFNFLFTIFNFWSILNWIQLVERSKHRFREDIFAIFFSKSLLMRNVEVIKSKCSRNNPSRKIFDRACPGLQFSFTNIFFKISKKKRKFKTESKRSKLYYQCSWIATILGWLLYFRMALKSRCLMFSIFLSNLSNFAIWRFFNSFMKDVPIIEKLVHWFALQILFDIGTSIMKELIYEKRNIERI